MHDVRAAIEAKQFELRERELRVGTCGGPTNDDLLELVGLLRMLCDAVGG
jgi:hypothetical protein